MKFRQLAMAAALTGGSAAFSIYNHFLRQSNLPNAYQAAAVFLAIVILSVAAFFFLKQLQSVSAWKQLAGAGIALIAAILLVLTVVRTPVPFASHDVVVSTKGEKNDLSTSAIVNLLEIRNSKNKPLGLIIPRVDEGWTRRKTGLHTEGKAVLHLNINRENTSLKPGIDAVMDRVALQFKEVEDYMRQTYIARNLDAFNSEVEETVSFLFSTGPGAGIVHLKVDGKETSVDLYADIEGEKWVRLQIPGDRMWISALVHTADVLALWSGLFALAGVILNSRKEIREWMLQRREVLLLTILALTAHGLLLLNDGIYMDSWLIYPHMVEKDFASLYERSDQLGLPVFFALRWLISQSPDILLTFKLINFFSLLLSGLLVFKIGLQTGLVSRLEAWLIAAFSMIYPAVQIWAESIMAQYFLSILLFLWAATLTLRQEELAGWRRWTARGFSLALFFLSFSTNSLLVLYFGFLLILYICKYPLFSPLKDMLFFGLKRLDYLALPFVFWLAQQVLFPKYGVAETYNKPELFNWPVLLRGSLDFFWYGVYGPLNEGIRQGVWVFILSAPILALPAIWMLVRGFYTEGMERRPVFESNRSWKKMSLLGILLVGMSIFPYIAVKKYPLAFPAYYDPYPLRHNLLIGLGMSIFLVGVLRGISRRTTGGFSMAGWLGSWGLAAAFVYLCVAGYGNLQARWIRDRAVMYQLSTNTVWKEISVMHVQDDFHHFVSPFEWAAMFHETWGQEGIIGLNGQESLKEFTANRADRFSHYYMMEGFDPAGCQANLILKRGQYQPEDNALLIYRYFIARLFDPMRMRELLNGVVSVSLTPHPDAQAVNCRLPEWQGAAP